MIKMLKMNDKGDLTDNDVMQLVMCLVKQMHTATPYEWFEGIPEPGGEAH